MMPVSTSVFVLMCSDTCVRLAKPRAFQNSPPHHAPTRVVAFFDTINRNPLARFASNQTICVKTMLRLLPRGTHDPAQFHQNQLIENCVPRFQGVGHLLRGPRINSLGAAPALIRALDAKTFVSCYDSNPLYGHRVQTQAHEIPDYGPISRARTSSPTHARPATGNPVPASDQMPCLRFYTLMADTTAALRCVEKLQPRAKLLMCPRRHPSVALAHG